MRTVTEKIVTAFLNGKHAKVGRHDETDGQVLRLFGKVIAKREGDTLYITDAGWRTPTTKDRLNGLLRLAGWPFFIYQHKGEWWARSPSGKVELPRGWVSLDELRVMRSGTRQVQAFE